MAALTISAGAWGAGRDTTLEAGTMAARLAACTACHGEQGKAGPDAYYPRLAGKPATYLYNQLVHFRDGERTYQPMHLLLRTLSDDYLREIARWFSEQRPAYDAPAVARVSPAVMQRGQKLALEGDRAIGVPACVACHGQQLMGAEPGVPGLLGIPRDYIASQFGAWLTGMRNAKAPDCMKDIARRLTPEDVAAVAAWLAAQPVPEGAGPAPERTRPLPLECGSQPVARVTQEVQP